MTLAAWSRRKILLALAALSGANLPALKTPALARSSDAATALQAQIKGTVAARGAPRYELWRQAMIWQHTKTTRQPELLVQVESVQDVIAAVTFARANGIKTTTRCGGHNLSSCFMREGGMLIDVSRLDGITVDTATGIASVGPGVLGAGLNQRLSQDGLAFPTAHSGMVPISGFLLGGGMGVNANGWSDGVSVLSVVAVDLVTADGILRRVSAREYPDLFWAVRGGGPGLFGVVTRFYLQCHAAPAVIESTTYTFRSDDLVSVAQALDEIAPQLDKNVEIMAVVAKGPPYLVKDFAGPAGDQLVCLQATAFAPRLAGGPSMLAPLANHPITGRAIAGPEYREDSFASYFTEHDQSARHSRRLADNIFTDDPVAAALVLARHLPQSPSAQSQLLLLYKGDPALPDAAYSAMGRFYLGYYFTWTAAHEEAANCRYALDVFNDLKPLSKGSYINEMNQEGRPQDLPSCYAPRAWARLAELRAAWDPDGVFQNFYGQA